MELYKTIKERQQAEYNNFSSKYMFYAFNQEQAEKGAEKLGLKLGNREDMAKIRYIGAGAYVLADKMPELNTIFKMHREELRTACTACGPAGYLLAVDMIETEMFNHEYGYTGETYETLQALPFTADEIRNTPALLQAWKTAENYVFENTEF